MLGRIIGGLLFLIVVLAGIGYLLPSQVEVSRSAEIDAPPARVFATLNGYRDFNKWSPWKELDPEAQYTIDGPESGEGAAMSWSGPASGTGRQTIVESRPDEYIRVALDFGDMGDAESDFTLEPAGTGTRVTWAMRTEMDAWNPLSRWMGFLVFGPAVGSAYEQGLANLKTYIESGEAAPPADTAAAEPAAAPQAAAMDPAPAMPATLAMPGADGPQIVTLAAKPILYVPGSAPAGDGAASSAALGAAFGQIMAAMAGAGLAADGAPLAINRSFDPQGLWEFDAAIPLAAAPSGWAHETVRLGETPAGVAAVIRHVGPYSTLATAYDANAIFLRAGGLVSREVSFEEYVSDPATAPEAELVTHVYEMIAAPE